MSGSVDQVELIFLPIRGQIVQTNTLGLDGDAALTLQVHGVEHLRGHLCAGVSAPVSSSRRSASVDTVAVVDVRDDTKIAYETRIHVVWRFRTRLLKKIAHARNIQFATGGREAARARRREFTARIISKVQAARFTILAGLRAFSRA